jgi:hypothetical protein
MPLTRTRYKGVGIDKVSFKNASIKVKRLVAEEVAPLIVKGHNARFIAAFLGVADVEARTYIALAHSMWEESLNDTMAMWRGRVFATYGEVMKELWEVWEQSKLGNTITTTTNENGVLTTTTRTAPPDPRWLASMLAVTKEVSTMLGMRNDAPVLQVQQVDESVRHSLAPMAPDAYMQLLAQNGGQLSVTVPPPPMQSAAVDVTPETDAAA